MKRDRILWVALLAGPVIWLTSFLTNFALAPAACVKSGKAVLLTVSATAMLLTVGSGGLAFHEWQILGARMPDEGGDRDNRARAMAVAAMASCGSSAMVILAQALVGILSEACQ